MGFFVLKLGFQDPGSVSLNSTEVTSGWLGLLGEGVGAGSWVWALGSPPRPPGRERKKRNEWSRSWGLGGADNPENTLLLGLSPHVLLLS